LVDVDGDGQLDVLTGSDNCCDGEPGFYWFRRESNEKFAAMPKVRVTVPVEGFELQQRMTTTLADWDGDGRLDVIVSQTRVQPAVYMSDGAWSAAAREVVAGIPVLGRPEHLFTQPCVVDWDGDGRLDLVVPVFRVLEDRKTAVYDLAWHRNVSPARPPRLAASERLTTLAGDKVLSGLSVADWDGDGWPDLIVGYNGISRDKGLAGVLVYPRDSEVNRDRLRRIAGHDAD
jgi:hypothetical protein